jgi:hypothetical protein
MNSPVMMSQPGNSAPSPRLEGLIGRGFHHVDLMGESVDA